jgi:hypothetical protein
MSRMLDARTSQTIESSLGGGKPLSEAASTQRSPDTVDADGAPVNDVRLHEDATAAALSKQMGAVAFTFGKDIFLAGDAPALDSPEGQRVLRHELTHVRQQQASGVTRPRRVSSPNSPAEHEATRIGDGAGPSSSTAAPGAVHRQEEEEEMQMMPAETVHRQEEEEEMLQPMPAETVHRQEEEEGAADQGAPAAANPALAALFDATVLAKHRAAIAALEGDPPDTATALAKVIDTWEGVGILSATYENHDPLLFAQLRRYQNAVNVAMQQLRAIEEGPRGPDAPHHVLSHPQVLGLGEQLRDQLH